jgi:uncharacterized integral membrane protein (TIGR00698 family)
MKQYISGLILTSSLAFISILLANFIPIGSVTIAILLGIILGNSVKINKTYHLGITFSEKKLLGFAIALMGVNLDFTILQQLGNKTLTIIVASMVVTIFSGVILGKIFNIDKKLALLLGIGNAVCGSSAISATAPVIKTNKNNIGLSVAIVNLLGTVGIFLVPFIAYLFNLNDIDTGILIGNTLQAVGQVTASGFSVSNPTGLSATTVKMGRVLLLTPLVFILIYLFRDKLHTKDVKSTKVSQVPLFILFFVLFSILSSFGFITTPLKDTISSIGHISLVIAMSAIGLNIHFNTIKNDGKIALGIATIIFAIQISFTLLLLLT